MSSMATETGKASYRYKVPILVEIASDVPLEDDEVYFEVSQGFGAGEFEIVAWETDRIEPQEEDGKR